jgi:hypothetical protein
MKTKLSIVISSHLSDIQTGQLKANEVNNRLNFIKWLMIKHRNLDEEIEPEILWNKFITTKFYQKY